MTVPLEEEESRAQICIEGRPYEDGEKTAIGQSEKAFQESNPEDILTSDIQPPES